MSFSSEIKKEIASITPDNQCCVKAKCYGMLLFSSKVSKKSIVFKTELFETAEHFVHLVKSACDVALKISTPATARGMYSVNVTDETTCSKILDAFDHSGDEVHLRINRGNIDNECCAKWFVSGAFLVCGSVTDPQKSYHAEFKVPKKHLSDDHAVLIGESIATPKISLRKSSNILYYKESEKIEELLTLVGSVRGVFEFMNVKIVKDMRNHINRTTNCVTANITKTADAFRKQKESIDIIEEKVGLEALPPDLYEVALFRKDNEFATLSELGQMLTPPLSRSGVSHRLKRIVEYADKLAKS